MTAGYLSASLTGRLSLQGNHPLEKGYYRSKLFIVPFTTNPLVAAAGPLFSVLERLCISQALPPLINIRENIEHELKAFHSRLNNHYPEELEAIAHYLLTATIDELVGKSYLSLHGTPVNFHAFTPLTPDQAEPSERFFDVVDYLKNSPNQFLDIIELAYYCLIIGFEGKYHAKADGRLMLDNLIEELFQLIQQYRVNKPHYLFPKTQKLAVTSKNYKPILLVSLLSIVLMATGVIFSYHSLNKQAKAFQFEHPVIAKLE